MGAGGKTTLLYALAAQARERGWSVLVTTTTHMGTLPGATTGPLLVEADGDVEPALGRVLAEEGRATVLGRRVRPDKLAGLAPERVDALRGRADLLLVEADGARGRSLKLPAPHEPVVPASTSLLVVLAGLDVLGRPLDEARVHRVDRVRQALGRDPSALAAADVAAVLAARDGYLAHRPAGSRGAVFLNKIDAAADHEAAAIAAALVPPWEAAFAGSAREGRGHRLA